MYMSLKPATIAKKPLATAIFLLLGLGGLVAEVPEIIHRCASRDEAALAVAQKVFKGLYADASNSSNVAAYLAILVAIRDLCKLVVKELTSWVCSVVLFLTPPVNPNCPLLQFDGLDWQGWTYWVAWIKWQPLELGSISNILPFSFFILIKFLPETLKNTIVFCDTLSSLLCFLLLDCKASDWPILYLGLPLGGNPIACGFWDPVIERISRRLDGWQKAYLSFGDRIALIHSCLSYILSYFLSLFKIPASVVAKIERLQRDFLWLGVGEGKRNHLVSWNVVCKPRVKGGLGFGKISLRNLALLGKWLWRYPRESTTLWHHVILSIYGTHSNGWDANTLVRWSHRCPWKAIAQVFQDFFKYTRFVVGDGERIRFWEDLWWGDQPLKSQYPRLFRVVTDKNIPISSIFDSARLFSWNFNFCRNLSDSEIEDLECLMRSLDCMHLSTSDSDARSWSLSSSGLFTVKSFFIALSQVPDLSPFSPIKFVWNSQVPFKVKSFV
ncbi:putative ribonuclease H protein [Vitis vinifera]|uniref:Putative ribonuclease H protein n=1 Tax=Vitis vinifera TaxID=29760 RepID=A0A438IK31_VITVI|nr:putative ribonuclease H protein [Vitis vinifera]